WYTILEATHDTLWVEEAIVDELLEHATALAASYQPDNDLQPSITWNKEKKTLTRSAGMTADAGSWIRDGFEVGMHFTVTPAGSNPGAFTIVCLDDTVLVVSEAVFDQGPSTMCRVEVTEKRTGGMTF